MKLATLKGSSAKTRRDGELAVVSRDLKKALRATQIAPTLQAALDNWSECGPALHKLSQELDGGRAAGTFDFDPRLAESPLPRAYQWVDGSAYVTHVELVRKARGADMPPDFWTDPLMYQGCSDSFLAPTAPIEFETDEWGIDFESEVVVVTDDVPMGVSPEKARSHIRLIMLVNDVTLRGLVPAELAKGFGFLQGKPASAFSPVAITPDELGDAWKDGKVHLPLKTLLNGQLFGEPNAGVDMTFDFGRLIAHAARTRHLCAGTIVGSGTISNTDRSKGSSCIAERRSLETIESGKPKTSFMRFGDRVKIEMLDRSGQTIFGAIDQEVRRYTPPR